MDPSAVAASDGWVVPPLEDAALVGGDKITPAALTTCGLRKENA